jgi:hypothetical protein
LIEPASSALAYIGAGRRLGNGIVDRELLRVRGHASDGRVGRRDEQGGSWPMSG